MGNQLIGWYPWGVLKRHMMNPSVWGETMTTDKALWTAITETRNHRFGYYSFMIKVINKECVMIKATPKGGIGGQGKGGKSGGKTPEDGGSESGKDKGDGKGGQGTPRKQGRQTAGSTMEDRSKSGARTMGRSEQLGNDLCKRRRQRR
eukprot:11008935-Heterocapsa_arctica.AAC.1